MGHVIGSIGEDKRFKLWQEDSTQGPNSGRRFKCIFAQSPAGHLPYMSLDFTAAKNEVRIALITKDGAFSLLEPIGPDSLGAWKEIDHFQVCTPPARGEESSFRLAFHHAVSPNFDAVVAGLPCNALSLAVAAMCTVHVYRAVKTGDGDYQFHQVADLSGHRGLVRNVAWAPGSYRPFDWVATACADGYVRIFELSTPHNVDGVDVVSLSTNTTYGRASTLATSPNSQNVLSGIGAGLAGASRAAAASRSAGSGGQVRHEWKLMGELRHDGVWNLKWIRAGK